jgi:hypothetical protein
VSCLHLFRLLSAIPSPPARYTKRFHHTNADTKHPRRYAVRPQGRSKAAGLPGSPRYLSSQNGGETPHSITASGSNSARSRGSISARARSANVKNASPARPAQTPICGNGSLARYKVIHAALDDRERAISVASGAMRRQRARTGAQRKKVAPERAVLRQVLAGDPRPGALVFHAQQSRVLSPSANT